jgi:hypothetical protein
MIVSTLRFELRHNLAPLHSEERLTEKFENLIRGDDLPVIALSILCRVVNIDM